jgi:hypothetical protein
MNNKALQDIYKYSYEYLLSILPRELHESDVQKYFQGDNSDFENMEEVFDRFIQSAQNYQSMPNVINYINRKNRVKEILYGLDISKVREMNVDELVRIFRKEFNVVTEDNSRNSWRKWSKSIINAAEFLGEFKSANEFRNYVESYSKDIKSRITLALIIAGNVSGMGFALVCDCLKELGFFNYSKPDEHIMDVMEELGMIQNENEIISEVLGGNFDKEFNNTKIKGIIHTKKKDLASFIMVNNIAESCKEIDTTVTPYKVDKIIWLCCSRKYYIHDIDNGYKEARTDYIRALKSKL